MKKGNQPRHQESQKGFLRDSISPPTLCPSSGIGNDVTYISEKPTAVAMIGIKGFKTLGNKLILSIVQIAISGLKLAIYHQTTPIIEAHQFNSLSTWPHNFNGYQAAESLTICRRFCIFAISTSCCI